MNKFKCIAMCCLLLAVLLLGAGCAAEETPYEINDGENFTISVKYDANGGFFTTNTSVIVDSYNVTQLPVGSNGKAQAALIAPDHPARGNDAFAPVNNGYFLAGWYQERQAVTDANGKTQYTYSGKWDFEKDLLEVDPNGTYSAAEPQLTLYAAWVPMFQVEFCDLDTGNTLHTYTFDPSYGSDLRLPQWSQETGAIEMYEFPEVDGFTYENAYYDAQGKLPVTSEALSHPGLVDAATGTAQNHNLKVYLSYTEGEWFHIYNVDQFLENASLNSSMIIHADLDFAEKIWPTALMYGNYNGTIEGGGHTFSNITLTQTNNSKINAGLFGRLSETAALRDIKLENVTFTIEKGTRVAGTSYGLLTGVIAEGAELTGISVTGKLQIDSDCYFGVDDYTIGLVCGMGDGSAVDHSGIACVATGENPDKVKITVDGNTVTATVDMG